MCALSCRRPGASASDDNWNTDTVGDRIRARISRDRSRRSGRGQYESGDLHSDGPRNRDLACPINRWVDASPNRADPTATSRSVPHCSVRPLLGTLSECRKTHEKIGHPPSVTDGGLFELSHARRVARTLDGALVTRLTSSRRERVGQSLDTPTSARSLKYKKPSGHRAWNYGWYLGNMVACIPV